MTHTGLKPTMSFHENYILPHVLNLVMRNRQFRPYRERVISSASGRVLEIGIGSGLNLPFYSSKVERLIGLDPSSRLLAMARRAGDRSTLPFELVEGSALSVPLDTASVDTVVTTWTLCTIPDAASAIREMRRVLRPNGELLFVEHGLAPDAGVRWWQDHLTPGWRRVGGGCHLNRPIRSLVESGGFRIARLETSYMRGPRPMTFQYEGRARPA